ncbi:MAG: hypothetical protein U1F43_22620 [Myxococcota bacterium]
MQARVLDSLVSRLAPTRRPNVTLLRGEPQPAAPNMAVAEQLARTHGVSVDLLMRQVQIFREIMQSIDGVPKSYRNIVDRIEDVQRAAVWLLSGATTQADFRRFFGTETFMRPTKSVAWDFFNRVFKRGPTYGPGASDE